MQSGGGAQEAAEAVTEPFAWHHGDFVKTTPSVPPLFLSRFRHVYLVPSLPTRFTRVQSKYTVFHYAMSKRDTSSNVEIRCASRNLPEPCTLFFFIVDRDFQSRTRIFSRTIAWKVFRCLSTRSINGTLDRTRDRESYGK